jgi:hypothetical protein
MVASTRARVAALTFGLLLITRETVWCETPAALATCQMLVAAPRSGGVGVEVSVLMVPLLVTRSSSEIIQWILSRRRPPRRWTPS